MSLLLRMQIVFLSVISLITASRCFAEGSTGYEETTTKFIDAFADGDVERMGKFYAKCVTVKAGSTILDKKFGGFGEDSSEDEDREVSRTELLNAYRITIEKLGGKEDWAEGTEPLKKRRIIYVTDKSENADKLFAAVGARMGDVIAVVAPEGDTLFFLLRKIDKNWKIIAEGWD